MYNPSLPNEIISLCLAVSNRYFLSKQSVALSFIFPGFVYHSSLFSIEQVTLMLSVLLVFNLFNRRYYYSVIILALSYALDSGNTQVVLVLIFYVLISMFIYKKLGSFVFILFTLISMVIAYIGSTIILNFVASYSDRIARIVLDYAEFDWNKWPLYLRPVMTFMSYNLMPPSMAKHPLLYIFVLSGIFYTFFKHYNSSVLNKVNFEYVVIPLALFAGISIIVFLLPGFNNAKYYIFSLPLFINSFLQYFSFKTVLIFLLILNTVVIVDNLLFYLIW